MSKATFSETVPTSRSFRYVWESRLEIALCLSVLILCIVTLRDFLHYIDAAPPFSVDDSLANIIIAILDYDRFGFLAAPQQIVYEIRSDRFYLFGPWYFYLGAALSWLFGFSTTLIRFIHPLVVVIIIGLAFLHFRPTSRLAAGIFSIAALFLFREAQWPMIRPDIMVTLFGILTIVLSGYAIQRDSFWAWFFASFTAAAAAISHLIAWAIPVGFAIMWLLVTLIPSNLLSPPGHQSRKALMSFSANALGALTSLMVWLISIDFRGVELAELIGRYWDFGNARHTQSYFELLLAQMAYVFPLSSKPLLLLFVVAFSCMIGLSLFALCLFALIKMNGEPRKTVVATSLPVLAIWGGYTLSLGIYPNLHTGYVIFAQFGVIWAGASVAAIAVYLCAYFGFSIVGKIKVAAFALLAALALQQSLSASMQTTSWEVHAKKNVDFVAYYNYAVTELPKRAKVWGDLIFSSESGRRIDIVQYGEGMFLYRSLNSRLKPQAYPEYIIASHSEQLPWILAFLGLKKQYGGKNAAPSLWINDKNNEGLHLIRIVSAPPYGATRIYATKSPGTPYPKVTIAVNDGETPNWETHIGADISFDAKPVAPVDLQFDHQGSTFEFPATRSVAIDLPAGKYLFTLDTKNTNLPSLIAVGTDTKVHASTQTYVPGRKITFISAEESETSVLAEHSGGPLLLSHFTIDDADQFTLTKVRPIIGLNTTPPEESLYVDEMTRCYGQRAKSCATEQN